MATNAMAIPMPGPYQPFGQSSNDPAAGFAMGLGNALAMAPRPQQGANALAFPISDVPRSNAMMPVQTDDIGGRLLSDLMRDFGLTREQAAGVVGNLAHESGGFNSLQEIAPVVPGSRGGYGYAQWTGPRRRAFEAWAQSQGLDPASYDANYGFLRHELTATPEGRVMDQLRLARDADAAATIFSDKFLRPGVKAADRRISLARKYAG